MRSRAAWIMESVTGMGSSLKSGGLEYIAVGELQHGG